MSARPGGGGGSGKVQRRNLSGMGSFFDGGCAGPGREIICAGELAERTPLGLGGRRTKFAGRG